MALKIVGGSYLYRLANAYGFAMLWLPETPRALDICRVDPSCQTREVIA